MKAFVPMLLGLCLLAGTAQAGALKQRKPSGRDLAVLKEAFAGKELIVKKALSVSSKNSGSYLFAPVMDYTANPALQLHLIQDKKIVFTFPPSAADKQWPILRFEGAFFKDLNDDGYEDMVTLTRYMPVSGPKANQVFTQATVYMGRGGHSFEMLTGEVNTTLNDTPPPSLAEVQKRLKKMDKRKLTIASQVSSTAKK